MNDLIAILLIVSGCAGMLAIVAASLLRCRYCRRWHTDATSEWLCKRMHEQAETVIR